MKTEEETTTRHHIDPITGAPHSHPVATGVGGAGGAITGAVIGAPLGPVGSLIGGAIGAAVGGLAGHKLGDEFDPYEFEEGHWKERLETEPYYEKGHTFEDYKPAYRMGHDAYPRENNGGKAYAEAEHQLGQQWDTVKGKSRLSWEQAKQAVKAGWHRVEESISHRDRHDSDR